MEAQPAGPLPFSPAQPKLKPAQPPPFPFLRSGRPSPSHGPSLSSFPRAARSLSPRAEPSSTRSPRQHQLPPARPRGPAPTLLAQRAAHPPAAQLMRARLFPAARARTSADPRDTDRPVPPARPFSPASPGRATASRDPRPRVSPVSFLGAHAEIPGALFKPPRGPPCSHPQPPCQNPSRSALPLLGAEHLAAVTTPTRRTLAPTRPRSCFALAPGSFPRPQSRL